MSRYAVALSHLYAALPFEFWFRVTCCPRSALSARPRGFAYHRIMCSGCGCRCTINGRPRGVPHPEHSCCVLARAAFSPERR